MSTMQSMSGAILLPFLLALCFSFQPVAGQDSQNTCATHYQTLADALINTGNNRYNLARGFFPPDDGPPVLVKTTYHFQNCSNRTWYWTEGAFYIYQPLRVFVFRSLFFAHISILRETVELQLPGECCDAPHDYFELLTQRLKAYAMFQTSTPRIDGMYYAKAVIGDRELDYKGHDVYGYVDGIHIDQLLLAYQYVPFIITFGIVSTGPILLCCLCCNCKAVRKKVSQKVKDATRDNRDQAVIVATVSLCSCATVYTFVLDMISSHMDDRSDLPGYYEQNQGIYVYTILFAFISLLFLIVGIVWFIFLLCISSYGPRCYCFCKPEAQNTQNHDNKRQDNENEKLHLALLIPIMMCVGSLVLSLSFHFQNILIAWSTDPFYASRIAVYYGIIIFVYYLTFKNTYILPTVCTKEDQPNKTHSIELELSTPTTNAQQSSASHKDVDIECCNTCIKRTWGCFGESQEDEKKERTKMRNTSCKVGLGLLCVAIVGVLLSGFHALNAVFIYYIPINNFIEESVHGVQTIYNGAVILIGGLIAYNVGWSVYHRTTFSVQRALEKALKELTKDPFGKKTLQYNSDEGEWEDLSEEDRVKNIMIALFIHGANKYKSARKNTV